MQTRFFPLWAGVSAGILLWGASAARAQGTFVGYDNLSTLSSLGPRYLFAYPNGSATKVGNNIITALAADDIKTAGTTSPFRLKSFSFIATNTNNAPVTVRPLLRIWDDDRFLTAEQTDIPGRLFASFNLPRVTLPAAPVGSFSSALVNYTFWADGLNITFNGKGRANTFYAGLVFDNEAGRTGATLAQMNGVGLLINDIFNDGSVLVGAGGDVVFRTNNDPAPGNKYFGVPGPNAFAVSNPPGYIANFFTGDPADPYANTAMLFNVANGLAAPEPSALALLGLGLVACAAWVVRRES